MVQAGRAIAPHEPRYGEVLEFLYEEAELLDAGRFSEWLGLLTEDISYRMPVRQDVAHQKAAEYSQQTEIFSENIASLRVRVGKLSTDFSWAESPPSRTRHLVTNVRVKATPDPNEVEILSYMLVHRQRAGQTHADTFAGERHDRLRQVDGEWRLARRTILLDQTVIAATHLGIIL